MAILWFSIQVQAATVTFTWDGSTDGSLTTGSNWVGGSSPPTQTNQAKDDHWIFPDVSGAGGATTITIDQGAGGNPRLQSTGTITFSESGSAYTIQSDGTYNLVITGEGVSGFGIRNQGSSTQTFDANVYLQGLQTWDSGTTAGGDMVFNGEVIFDNNSDTLTLDGSNDFTFDAITNNTGSTTSIAVDGSGTTTVNGVMDKIEEITLNDGTFLLGADNLIQDTNAKKTNLTLNGGEFDTGGYDATFRGTLTLSADSTIDLDGAGSGSVLEFGDSSGETWATGTTLAITGWDGNIFSGGGDDQIIFTSSGINPTQLGQIVFVNPGNLTGNYAARLLPTGEIIPVPEVSTIIAGLLPTLGIAIVEIRRRKKQISKNE